MSYQAPKEVLDWLDKDEEITDLDVLRRQVKYLRITARDFRQYLDCVTSPIHKRMWWWLGGYCFNKVGRWYSEEKLIFKIWYKLAKLVRCT